MCARTLREQGSITVEFELEKETRNTVRYREVMESSPPVIPALYVTRWVLGSDSPRRLRVVLTAVCEVENEC